MENLSLMNTLLFARRDAGRSRLRGPVAALAVAAVLGAAGSGRARADFINGSYETGTFSGWTTIGRTSIQTAAFGVTPTDGTFQALATNTTDSVSASGLETFLGLSAGSLTTLVRGGGGDPTTTAIEGSGIKQTVTANAGDVLTFAWDFLTRENLPDAFSNDTAFIAINGMIFRLANTFSSGFSPAPAATGFLDHTGYRTGFSFTIPSAGSYLVGVGVVDAGDNSIDSGLLVDNFVLRTGVPEPASVALLGLGGLGFWSLGRRRPKAR
jgi:hypothetical protein